MRLQTSTMLALYSIIEAASHPGKQVSAAEIAERYGVSAHHLAKVLRELGRAGLVDSSRGAGGGYRFSGNARRLTLMDVIERFEDIGARSPDPGTAQTDLGLAIARVLSEIDEIAKATFRSITIETLLKLVERARRSETSE
ncbi:MAG: transcriptional regulator [Betaproteobacteria bacterium RIFCSPLOWO2_02_FULL_63_19]|nr:MAG: transcriptional regulator [Betaproteobacteria bacterium RIFCSPLOWO2_02_FULL_63_19]OGA71397.1 MAG: transcriptional regulator [Betaproteobacteria bacterium RIFCSPLOWO2_12_FULL_65_14]